MLWGPFLCIETKNKCIIRNNKENYFKIQIICLKYDGKVLVKFEKFY